MYLSFSHAVEQGGDFDIREYKIGGDQITLCPTDYLTPDAEIFFSVYAYNANTSYQIVVESVPIPLYNVSDNFQQSGEGDLIASAATVNDFVTLTYLTLLYQSCLLHVEAVGYLQMTLTIDGVDYPASAVPYNGKSTIDISICTTNSSGGAVFHAKIVTLSLFFPFIGDAVYMYTTNPYYELIPVYRFPIYDSAVEIIKNVGIQNVSGDCSVTAFWSSVSGNAFNPPHPYLFPRGSGIYLNSIWDYPATVDPHVIYSYFLIPGGISTVNVSTSFCTKIGPFIMDHLGRMLVGNGTICPSPKEVKCDAELAGVLASQLLDLLSVLLNSTTVSYSELAFLDAIRYNTSWSACERFVEYFFNASVESDFTLSSTQIQTDLMNQQCGTNATCVELFLEDFLRDQSHLVSGACEPQSSNSSTVDSAWYKECKGLVYPWETDKLGRICQVDDDCVIPARCTSAGTCDALGIPCSVDSDCSVHVICDYFRGVCNDTQEIAENLFTRCFIDKMTPDVQGYLAERENITISDKHSPSYFTEFQTKFQTNDCVGRFGNGMSALSYRSHTIFYLPSFSSVTVEHCECYDEIGDEYSLCLDSICVRPPQCEHSVFDDSLLQQTVVDISGKSASCSYQTIGVKYDLESCLAEEICTWVAPSSSYPLNASECSSLSFCGVTLDPSIPLYYPLVGVDEAECSANGVSVCVTPQRVIFPLPNDNVTSQSTCEDAGFCTGLCYHDNRCVPVDPSISSVCYDQSPDESACRMGGGVWTDDGWCVFPYQNMEDECVRNGHVFLACSSLPLSDCGHTPSGLLECYVGDRDRCGRSECVSPAGYCEDNDFLIVTRQSPPVFSACVMPFAVIPSNDQLVCYSGTTPTNIGCVNSHLDETSCTQSGGKFYNASRTFEECMRYGVGCRTINTTFTGLLTPLRLGDACDGVIEPLFRWHSAQWVPGRIGVSETVNRKMISANLFGPTLNFVNISYYVTLPSVTSQLNDIQDQVDDDFLGIFSCCLNFILSGSLCQRYFND